MNRDENLRRVRERQQPCDLVVIGGGATGVGCALDAASRGLDVLLLEQHDLGKGTSSRSTKLVHGGVRYLAQGDIPLVREALKERGILLRNAPHVVHKQPFIVPCYSLWQKLYYGLGLKVYDLLSGKYSFGKSRMLSKAGTLDQLPTARSEGLTGGVLYFDGQFDDARLLIDMAVTASRHGAAVLNYAKVDSLVKGDDGRISGVEFVDQFSGERFVIQAKAVINATGAFCDGVRTLAATDAKPLVTLSQGIHLVFDRKFLPGDAAIMIPKTSDGRVLFCIPWHGYTLVGTTDTPINDAKLEPRALESEVEFVLETAAAYMTKRPTRSDVLSVFVGIRPLVRSAAARKTSSLSRGHLIDVDEAGMITITGGKWTTYRQMAEDAVNEAVGKSRSVTSTLAIAPPTASKGEPLHPDLPYNREDVLRAVHDEMALTVEDVLARRTRALFLNAEAAIGIAPIVAKVMAAELGRDNEWVKNQLIEFNETAAKYLISETGS